MRNWIEIIDKHLKKWNELGLNQLPIAKIEKEMMDSNQNPYVKWKTWFPIESTVLDSEIDDLEKLIGFKYPIAYRDFLKYKHFYELQIGEVSFCSHPVNIWKASLTELYYESYPREFIIDKGLIPFAKWNDWGLLCFNANSKNKDQNYPIVRWDHERIDRFEPIFNDFVDLIVRIDK